LIRIVALANLPTLSPLYAHIALNVKVVFLTCVYKSVNRCRKQILVTQPESVLKSEPTSFLNIVFHCKNVYSKYINIWILKQWKKTFEEISKFSVNSIEGYFNILGFESKFPSLILSSVHEYWVSLNQLLYWTVQRFVFVRVRLLLGYFNRFSKGVTI
jgi:hypothetical protein